MDQFFFKNDTFTWYDLKNPNQAEVEKYMDEYKLTSYTVQDAIEVGHLPKHEHFENFDFVIIRFYCYEKQSHSYLIREYSNKIGIFFGSDFLITIHQKGVPFFENLKLKLESNVSKWTPHKVFHEIIRGTLNTYYEPAEKIAEQIDDYERSLLDDDREIKQKLKSLYLLKRKSDVCNTLMARTRETLNEYKLHAKNKSAFLDLVELNQKLQHLHEQNSNDLKNLFTLTISLSDLRSNEIMKVLTVFSAFFLPLTFIVGLYGMNFEYMPELGFKWAYFIVLALMFAIVVVIFLWFRRKRFI